MFSVGDVVQLKSGGPIMTVAGIDGNDVNCVWFDGPKQNGGQFPAAALKKFERPTQRNFAGGGPEF